jgi:DNA-binding PadR family transcriptional regulator
MTDDTISDAGIAVMCDIARLSSADIAPNHRAELDRLVTAGFVECTTHGSASDRPAYAITRKGQHALDDRGVGVNES